MDWFEKIYSSPSDLVRKNMKNIKKKHGFQFPLDFPLNQSIFHESIWGLL